MKRAVVVACALVACALLGAASMGPAASIGSTAGGGTTAGASVTYPDVDVQVGGYVSVTPTVSGGTATSFSVKSGDLPDGLSLNASTGAITGSVTTTALMVGKKRLGTSTNLGRHIVVIETDIGDTSVSIDVIGIGVPTPQHLLVFSDAYKSGSNFTDAINGSITWTKTAGTTDTVLTDADSPLGYAHEFSSTYFAGTNGILTDSKHSTAALFLRERYKASAGNFAVHAKYFGNGATDSRGIGIGTWADYFGLYCHGSVSAGAGCVTSTTNFNRYTSMVHVLDDGSTPQVKRGYFDGDQVTFGSTPNTTVNIGGGSAPIVGTNDFSTTTYYTTAAIAEVAYWPRSLNDTAHLKSMDWCWHRGVSLKDCDGTDAPSGATVTITPTAPAYERPVTCTGSYTLTGSTANATAVTWRADPSGDTGTCSGTSSYSCVVAVSPDAAGEGVETVSITATGDDGVAIARQDVGFYVTGARDCFLSQSVDGLNNTTNADNDAVTTWVNLISADRNVTQSSAGAKPTVQEGVGSGVYVQPLVSFDGGDVLADDTASDWTWLHNGTDSTVEVVGLLTSGASTQVYLTTNASVTDCSSNLSIGYCLRGQSSSATKVSITATAVDVVNATTSSSTLTANKYSMISAILDDDNGGGADLTTRINDAGATTGSRSGSYTSSDGSFARVGSGNTHSFVTGSIFRLMTYQSALSSTQRGINKAVDEWALGNSLPVNP